MPRERPHDGDPADLVDRAIGCLAGLALGDALGAPFEGATRVDRAAIDGLLTSDDPLRWTDDTHMMLALADSLLACGAAVEPQHLGDTFAARYHEEPWRGYGAGPPHVFALAATGMAYVDAAATLFDGSGSLGNGAAMRCAPVAVAGHPDAGRTRAMAAAQAAVTHAHPEGRDGATLLAAVIDLALRTPAPAALELRRLDPRSDTADLPVTELRSPTMRAAVDVLIDTGPDSTTARRFGSAVAARSSVPAAISVAVTHPHDVVDTIRAAIQQGGDTDTVAAMAAAITGAHLGSGDLPGSLLRRLEAHDRIAATAARLAQRDI